MRRGDLIAAALVSTLVHAALLLPGSGAPSRTQTLGGEFRTTRGTLGVALLPPLPAPQPEPVAAEPPAARPRVSKPRAAVRVVAKSVPRFDRAPESAASLENPTRARSEVQSAPDPIMDVASGRTPPVSAVGAAEAQPLGVEAAVIRPSYPWRARRLGQEGRVLVQVAFDSVGRVRELDIAQSSGYRLLDREALAAVRRAWAPREATRGSAPGAGSELLEIVFQLDD